MCLPSERPLAASDGTDGEGTSERTIVIIGAGSIGLSTAYHLALHAAGTTPRTRIVDLDTLPKPFGATSGSCTGCLHYEFRESEGASLVELGKYSFELWESLSANEEFRMAVGYRPHCFFQLSPGRGLGLDALPDWFEADPAWNTDKAVLEAPSAIVNPKGVGVWLASECHRLGVDIRLSATATSVELSSTNVVQSVTYDHNGSRTRLDCQTLVLAAGPWTPTIYQALFPTSSIKLQAALNAGDWILFRNTFPMSEKSISYIALDGIVGEKLEFVGRDDRTIWLIGRKDHNATLPPLGESSNPNQAMIAELAGRADERLRHVRGPDGQTSKTPEIVGMGRAIRPTANTILPVISGVGTEDIAGTGASTSQSSGVFVSWGHGSYGLTLGMGTGKIMSQLIHGQKPDIDISLFDIARDKALARL